jgi:hypothetical protein
MNNITEKQIKDWTELLRQIPVSVNNFYGDPLIQWQDTCEKLEDLARTKHSGPVSIITKGKFTKKHIEELKDFEKRGLRIVVFISISEMPQFEKVGMEHRYENIRLLSEYGIPNVAYIRPLTPPYNTSKEVIELIFEKLSRVGAKTVVASGFRGDDNLVKDMSPDDKIQWTMRVKIMSKDVYAFLKENSEKYGIQLFTRTSCAVSCLLGDSVTYNPYYNSPNLVKCSELHCPLVETCKPPLMPKEGSLEFARFLGYDVELIEGDNCTRCKVEPDKRLSCPSCCTSCFLVKTNRVSVKGKVGLGDIALIRFLTGMLAMQVGKVDGGDKNVGVVTLPNFSEIGGLQCLNSWWPYAHVGKTCFDCTYCMEKYYGSGRVDFGFAPADLMDKIVSYKKGEDEK